MYTKIVPVQQDQAFEIVISVLKLTEKPDEQWKKPQVKT